jgi:hypothetical protein
MGRRFLRSSVTPGHALCPSCRPREGGGLCVRAEHNASPWPCATCGFPLPTCRGAAHRGTARQRSGRQPRGWESRFGRASERSVSLSSAWGVMRCPCSVACHPFSSPLGCVRTFDLLVQIPPQSSEAWKDSPAPRPLHLTQRRSLGIRETSGPLCVAHGCVAPIWPQLLRPPPLLPHAADTTQQHGLRSRRTQQEDRDRWQSGRERDGSTADGQCHCALMPCRCDVWSV